MKKKDYTIKRSEYDSLNNSGDVNQNYDYSKCKSYLNCKKRELELQIHNLINKFNKETCFTVDSINITTLCNECIGVDIEIKI